MYGEISLQNKHHCIDIDRTIIHGSHLPIDEKAAAVGRRPMKASAIGDTFIVLDMMLIVHYG
jgi:hypothetical protein